MVLVYRGNIVMAGAAVDQWHTLRVRRNRSSSVAVGAFQETVNRTNEYRAVDIKRYFRPGGIADCKISIAMTIEALRGQISGQNQNSDEKDEFTSTHTTSFPNPLIGSLLMARLTSERCFYRNGRTCLRVGDQLLKANQRQSINALSNTI
jgi:hypothetical protein